MPADPHPQERPDVDDVLRHLKDFQRRTVDHVHARLWDDADPSHRFLVADEVGLGKTLVAKGVIAKAVDQLWDTVDRIDVVYICSNQQIARQNLARLTLRGHEPLHAERLTLMPLVTGELAGKKLNFVSFTPGTSLQVTSGGGRALERVVMYWMLARGSQDLDVRPRRWLQFFRDSSSLKNFTADVERFRRHRMHELDLDFAAEFAEQLSRDRGPRGGKLLDELVECVQEFNYLRGNPAKDLSRRRSRIIGAMRATVARLAIERLEPDLVVMDEFQRFSELMRADAQSEAAELLHALVSYAGADGTAVRTLLLSATPYKMYTLPDEPDGEDHYRDFVSTVEFLAGADRAATVRTGLATMREGMLASTDESAVARAVAARDTVERELRRVICRTERLAATREKDGMLREVVLPGVEITAGDLLDHASLDDVARTVHAASGAQRQDMLEFWRSTPYTLNLMDRRTYKVKTLFDDAVAAHAPAVTSALASARGLLPYDVVDAYERLDPGNAKMRGLVTDVLDREAWRLAWLPASLPYYEPAGPFADPGLARFTKRLAFSAWNVAPKAISVVVSYEAERRATTAASGGRRRYGDPAPTPRLQYRISEGRLDGMPTFLLSYPSVALADAGDPLRHARAAGRRLTRGEVDAAVRAEVESMLAILPPGDPSLRPGADQRWYWAAPLLLDAADGAEQDGFFDVLGHDEDADEPDGAGHARTFERHVAAAREIRADELGARPHDLVDVLTVAALAAPGTCALRALGRAVGSASDATPAGWWASDADVREIAFGVGGGFRSLFNRPETQALVDAERADATRDDTAYWRSVLEYCADGGLQAVLDEYAHTLVESEGLVDKTVYERAARIGEVLRGALQLRTPTSSVDDIRVVDGQVHVEERRVRTHFAARFGRGTTDEGAEIREEHVRTAFNSPFWPFVLASTSVGQEGLDFHTYSHAVVHWNLPGNPVDLEQREGRVHRYKGHAVRKNVAQRYGDAAFTSGEVDPWAAAFAAAAQDRPDGATEIFPSWVCAAPGGATIERYVPALPLSKEVSRYRRLRRTVRAYRSVIGQARQEDLLRLAGDADLSWAHIDLSP
ncbi:helicase-related protein [Cellulosimicrobium funkei]|uniref:helicase-related protein n=1 Tax=Cellulosimicrobium funkei TaxID=264251 RepID=UPI00379D7E20